MNHLDLFSGIGTWSYAFHKYGVETVGFCEKDSKTSQFIEDKFPGIDIFNDVCTLKFSDLPKKVDIITASYPCQDLSTGGKKAGLVDGNGNLTRSGLFYEATRLASEIRPKYFILENVGRQLKQDFPRIQEELFRIGFDYEWHILRATDFKLPHQRERLFIISHPREFRLYERLREKRYLHPHKKRKSETPHAHREQCEFKSREVCSILSRGGLESYLSTQASQKPALSGIRRVVDGISEGVYPDKNRDRIEKELEKIRKQRIKQLGNAIVLPAAEFIIKSILEVERKLHVVTKDYVDTSAEVI